MSTAGREHYGWAVVATMPDGERFELDVLTHEAAARAHLDECRKATPHWRYDIEVRTPRKAQAGLRRPANRSTREPYLMATESVDAVGLFGGRVQ